MASRDYLIPNDPENGYDDPADLSIESAIGHDSDNLYLAINVRDDVHFQPFSAGKLWAADSIQLVIDTRRRRAAERVRLRAGRLRDELRPDSERPG